MRFQLLYARPPADLLHPVVQVPIGQWIVPAIHKDRVSQLRGRPIFSHVPGKHIPGLVADIYPMAFLFLSGPLGTLGLLAVPDEDSCIAVVNSQIPLLQLAYFPRAQSRSEH